MASGIAAESPVKAEPVSVVAPAETTDDAPSTMKEPPPEKPFDVRRRTVVVMSFWLIVILLGVPIWWQTTSIYRANLPLDGMLQWADGKVVSNMLPARSGADIYRLVVPSSLSKSPSRPILYKIKRRKLSFD